MKTLVISIIAGLLYLNPAFAQTQDTDRTTRQSQKDSGIQSDRTGPAGQGDEMWTPGAQRERDRNRSTPDFGRGDGDYTGGEGQPRVNTEQRPTNQDGQRNEGVRQEQGMDGDRQEQRRTDTNRRTAPGEGTDSDQQVRPRDAHEQQEPTTDQTRPHRTREVAPQEGYDRVSPSLITVEDLQNANVYDSNHENVGNIDQVLITPQGDVERVVMDVGGFLGIGARSVVIDIEDLDIHRNGDDLRVYIPMTEEELRAQPEYRDN